MPPILHIGSTLKFNHPELARIRLSSFDSSRIKSCAQPWYFEVVLSSSARRKHSAWNIEGNADRYESGADGKFVVSGVYRTEL